MSAAGARRVLAALAAFVLFAGLGHVIGGESTAQAQSSFADGVIPPAITVTPTATQNVYTVKMAAALPTTRSILETGRQDGNTCILRAPGPARSATGTFSSVDIQMLVPGTTTWVRVGRIDADENDTTARSHTMSTRVSDSTATSVSTRFRLSGARYVNSAVCYSAPEDTRGNSQRDVSGAGAQSSVIRVLLSTTEFADQVSFSNLIGGASATRSSDTRFVVTWVPLTATGDRYFWVNLYRTSSGTFDGIYSLAAASNFEYVIEAAAAVGGTRYEAGRVSGISASTMTVTLPSQLDSASEIWFFVKGEYRLSELDAYTYTYGRNETGETRTSAGVSRLDPTVPFGDALSIAGFSVISTESNEYSIAWSPIEHLRAKCLNSGSEEISAFDSYTIEISATLTGTRTTVATVTNRATQTTTYTATGAIATSTSLYFFISASYCGAGTTRGTTAESTFIFTRNLPYADSLSITGFSVVSTAANEYTIAWTPIGVTEAVCVRTSTDEISAFDSYKVEVSTTSSGTRTTVSTITNRATQTVSYTATGGHRHLDEALLPHKRVLLWGGDHQGNHG